MPSTPITTDTTSSLILLNSISSPARSIYIYINFFSFIHIYRIARNPLFVMFSCCWLKDPVFWPSFNLKSQRILCILFFGKYSGICLYHCAVWSKCNPLKNSQWITVSTQLCLFLYLWVISHFYFYMICIYICLVFYVTWVFGCFVTFIKSDLNFALKVASA